MAVGNDLILQIDATTTGLQAGIAKANASLLSYESNVHKAALAAAQLDRELEMEQAKAFNAAKQAADAHGQALTKVGTGMVIAGGLMALGIGKAVMSFADFDSAMSGVQAATHESEQNMGALRQAALDLGASSVFTASEVAGAEENLAKAGISTADILGGALKGALDLAAAGQLAVADAAEFTATALTQFGLKGDQASHVADVLAAGAGKAQGEVGDLAVALNYAGLPAHALGVTLEQTSGTLALFAKNGLIGEQAGTSLRGVLASLQAPSQQAKDKLDELGVSIFDSSGKFVGLADLAGQLHDRLGNATDAERSLALGVIFGNQQLQAANILVNEGADGVAEWTGKVDDSGYAAMTAAIQMDNLRGDVEKLGGAIDSALIQSGSGANDVLREIVQTATFLVDAFGDAPPIVQKTALALGAAGTAALLLGGAALIVIPRLGALANTLDEMALSSGRAVVGMEAASVASSTLGGSTSRAAGAIRGMTATALGPWGLAVGAAFTVASIALGGWLHSMAEHKQDVDEFTNSLDAQTGALTDQSAKLITSALESDRVADAMDKLGLKAEDVAAAIAGQGDAYDELQSKLSALTPEARNLTDAMYNQEDGLTGAERAFGAVSDSANDTRGNLSALTGEVGGAERAWGGYADKTQAVADADTAGAIYAVNEAVASQRAIIDKAIDQWRQNKAIQDAVAPSVDAVTQSVSSAAQQTETLTDRTDKLNDAQRSIMERFGETADAAIALGDAIDADKEAFDRLNGVNITAIQTQINYQSTLDDAADAIKKVKDSNGEMGRAVNDAGTAFDLTTEAGRLYSERLIKIAQDGAAQADATYDQTTQHDLWIKSLQQARTDLINEAKQMGLTQDAAEALADQILAIPEDHNTVVTMDINDLVENAGTANATINGIPLSKLTKLEGDPSGVTDAVREAQDAIDGLHGKTINVYLDFKLSQEEYLGGGYDDGQGGSTYGDRKYGGSQGKSFGQQSYGDDPGGRFGQQSVMEQGAMAGTRSQQVGGADYSQAFAAALGAQRPGSTLNLTIVHPREEPSSRMIAAAADHINWFSPA